MSEFVLDLTGYKDRIGSKVDEGRYRVIVDDAEMDKSKAGNPMVNVWFRILDGDFEGATITDRMVLTDKSLFRIVGFMTAIGLPTPKKRLKLSLAQFVGKVLDIDVEDGEPYNGRVKSEVRGYNRVSKPQAVADVTDLPEAEDEPEEVEAYEPPSTPEPEPKAPSNAAKAEEVEEIDLDDLDLG